MESIDAEGQFSKTPTFLNGDGTQDGASYTSNLGGMTGESKRVWRFARQDGDREATRYLSAAAQFDVRYAEAVVRRVVNEQFRALAPSYGADVAAVTRWAVDSVRRRARRDIYLAIILIAGIVLAWLCRSRPLISVVSLAAAFLVAWVIVSLEQWVRIHQVIVKKMSPEAFDPTDAPESTYQWIRERIDSVPERRRGNLVVFRGERAFVGSGRRLSKEHIVIDVSHGRKAKGGKTQQPKPFTNIDVHRALISAMRKIGFADVWVEERLFVNGRHIKGSKDFLPHGETAPPAASVSLELMREAALHPTPDARVYVCVEMPGWQGQLVVTLFVRAVHAGGLLYLEWEYYVLPPVRPEFLAINNLHGASPSNQLYRSCSWGTRKGAPALVKAPFAVLNDLWRIFDAKRRSARWENVIRQGQGFDYGAVRSIREDACGTSRLHYFLARDEIMYVLMSQQVLEREIRDFLRKHDVALSEFDEQIGEIAKSTHKYYNIHIGNVSESTFAVGDKAQAKKGNTNRRDR